MNPAVVVDVTEQKRLNDAREAQIPWKKWGLYLSERRRGTVSEDYSDDGPAGMGLLSKQDQIPFLQADAKNVSRARLVRDDRRRN